MRKYLVSWFIAIIISTKSCMTSIEFPMLNFKSILPRENFTLFQNLYHTPSNLLKKSFNDAYKDVSAVLPQTTKNVTKKVNPLNYLMLLTRGNLYAQYTTVLHNFPLNRPSPNPKYMYFLKNKVKEMYSDNKPVIYPSTHRVSVPMYDIIGYGPIKSIINYDKNVQSTMPTSSQVLTNRKSDTTPIAQNVNFLFDHFLLVLEQLERMFYQISFRKLTSISPPERRENGISFAQSSLFFYIQLMAMCTESDAETKIQIKDNLGLKTTCEEQVQILKNVMPTLPASSDFLKFRWSSRLILGPRVNISDEFSKHIASALHIHLDRLNKTNNSEELAKLFNHMIERDSGGAMHNTFEEDELSDGICAVWLTTIYIRARWRSAPTVLKGFRPFYDSNASQKTVRMIRINDIMRYARLVEWDAEAIEIRYAYPELTFLILLPRERSLQKVVKKISSENLKSVFMKMRTTRVAVTLPIYTLRMTLLLPNKLEMMGISRLVARGADNCDSLKLSHAVQRIMFWAEAGRNAFKDDGLEWDDAPELERVVDRPYMFFVRWRNITLLNGNFVL